jgi:hypothetical protein
MLCVTKGTPISSATSSRSGDGSGYEKRRRIECQFTVQPSLRLLAKVVLREGLLVHRLHVDHMGDVCVAAVRSASTLLRRANNIRDLRRHIEFGELCLIAAFLISTREVHQDGVHFVGVGRSSATPQKASQIINVEWEIGA